MDCTGPNGEKTTVWLQHADDNDKPVKWWSRLLGFSDPGGYFAAAWMSACHFAA